MRAKPIKCALCGALFTSVVEEAIKRYEFVFSTKTQEAVCKPCIEKSVQRFIEGPIKPVDTSHIFNISAYVEL